MLANSTDIERIDRYQHYVMEPKLDGNRCTIIKMSGHIELYSRTGKRFTDKVPHLVDALRLAPDAILDGEIGIIDKEVKLPHDPHQVWPIFDFNATARVMGSGADVAVMKQDYLGLPVFMAFDWSTNDGIAHTYKERRLGLHTWYTHIKDMGAEDLIRLTPVREGWNEHLYTEYVDAGGEGVILKDPFGYYFQGKRPAHNWVKVKKFQTADVVILGFTTGEGKYENQIGAVVFGLCTGVVPYKYYSIGKCSGMDDMLRFDMTNNWSAYQGRVMEIRFFGQVGATSEGLRHPQYSRMRPDKNPWECTSL
jgi:ATP-dependent DNA ligase